MASPEPTTDARRTSALESVGVYGLVLTIIGAICVLLSFTVFTWYEAPATSQADRASATGLTFGDLHSLTNAFAAPGLSAAYFGWLAWVLLLVAVFAGLCGGAAGARGAALRLVGCIAGLGGAIVTYLAVERLFSALHAHGGTETAVFDHAQPGLYLVLAGYILAGVGAANSTSAHNSTVERDGSAIV